MSISEQCRLLQVPRSSFYYRSQRSSGGEDEVLMQVIDRIFIEEPTFGSRRMSDALQELGYAVGRQRTGRLMGVMGIEPIYPKPRLSAPGKGHKVYPYLLRGLDICRPQSGLVYGHHLHPAGHRPRLSGCGYGLVQPQGAQLATV